MIVRTWKIYVMDPICDLEMVALEESRSRNGIIDSTIAESGRIIVAETDEEETVQAIVAWLSEGLIDVTILAGIEESKWYYPEFEDEGDREALEVFVSFDD